MSNNNTLPQQNQYTSLPDKFQPLPDKYYPQERVEEDGGEDNVSVSLLKQSPQDELLRPCDGIDDEVFSEEAVDNPHSSSTSREPMDDFFLYGEDEIGVGRKAPPAQTSAAPPDPPPFSEISTANLTAFINGLTNVPSKLLTTSASNGVQLDILPPIVHQQEGSLSPASAPRAPTSARRQAHLKPLASSKATTAKYNDGKNSAVTTREGADVEANLTTAQRDRWLQRCKELQAYKQEHGHCCVPTHYPPNQELAQWTKRQRYERKLWDQGRRSTLTTVRIKDLDKLGFVWDSHELFWNERLEDFKFFQRKYGHGNVPAQCQEFSKLPIWVKCQRRQFKILCEKGPGASSLSWDRLMKLAKENFTFDPRAWKRNLKSDSPLSTYGLLNKLIPLHFQERPLVPRESQATPQLSAKSNHASLAPIQPQPHRMAPLQQGVTPPPQLDLSNLNNTLLTSALWASVVASKPELLQLVAIRLLQQQQQAHQQQPAVSILQQQQQHQHPIVPRPASDCPLSLLGAPQPSQSVNTTMDITSVLAAAAVAASAKAPISGATGVAGQQLSAFGSGGAAPGGTAFLSSIETPESHKSMLQSLLIAAVTAVATKGASNNNTTSTQEPFRDDT